MQSQLQNAALPALYRALITECKCSWMKVTTLGKWGYGGKAGFQMLSGAKAGPGSSVPVPTEPSLPCGLLRL